MTRRAPAIPLLTVLLCGASPLLAQPPLPRAQPFVWSYDPGFLRPSHLLNRQQASLWAWPRRAAHPS